MSLRGNRFEHFSTPHQKFEHSETHPVNKIIEITPLEKETKEICVNS